MRDASYTTMRRKTQALYSWYSQNTYSNGQYNPKTTYSEQNGTPGTQDKGPSGLVVLERRLGACACAGAINVAGAFDKQAPASCHSIDFGN